MKKRIFSPNVPQIFSQVFPQVFPQIFSQIFRFSRPKKGSVFLSLIATGAVAATIVATHQIVQHLGSSSEIGRQEAYSIGSQALMIAGMMVSENIVLCSRIKESNEVLGCDHAFRRDDGDSQKQLAKKFFDELELTESTPKDNFTREWLKDEDNNDIKSIYGQNLILKETKIKSRSPFHGVHSVTWSLRDWSEPGVGGSIRSIFEKGWLCQRENTYQILDDKYCPPPGDLKNLDALQLEPKKCLNSKGGSAVTGSVCHYLSAADYDENMVYIEVQIPYTQETDQTYEDSGGNIETRKKKQMLVVKGAVRRPPAILLFDNSKPAQCAQKCEGALSASGINDYPQCVGISDHGGAATAESKITITNKGPGVLYDLKLRREDIDNKSRDVLLQTMVNTGFKSDAAANADQVLFPGESYDHEDSIPCYASTYYRLSMETITCNCFQPNRFNSGVSSGGQNCADVLGGQNKAGIKAVALTKTDAPPFLGENRKSEGLPGVFPIASSVTRASSKTNGGVIVGSVNLNAVNKAVNSDNACAPPPPDKVETTAQVSAQQVDWCNKHPAFAKAFANQFPFCGSASP